MNMTISKAGIVTEVISSTQSRRRWTLYEKHQIVQETYHPGVTVSYIARKHGIPPSQLFYWRKNAENGAMTSIKSEGKVAAESEVQALKKHIKKLEQTLGQKTLENEILKEAVKIGREKKTHLATTLARCGRFGVRAIARALQVARSHLTDKLKRMVKRVTRYNKQEDSELLPYIREIIDLKASYGYRRVTVLLNRKLSLEGKSKVNHNKTEESEPWHPSIMEFCWKTEAMKIP